MSILRRVKHPNIIMLVEEMETATELFLVMELVKVRGWTDFLGAKSQDVTVVLKDLIRKGFYHLGGNFIYNHPF